MNYRQGDVGLVRVQHVPADVTPVPRDAGRIVLAYGEVTGHAHAIVDEAAELVVTDTNERFLRIMNGSGVELRHEEHATITLPPGNYRVVQQREYLAPEIVRQVMD